MQQRKQNWKRLRTEIPCRKCGKQHETKNCVSRKGRHKPDEPATYRRYVPSEPIAP